MYPPPYPCHAIQFPLDQAAPPPRTSVPRPSLQPQVSDYPSPPYYYLPQPTYPHPHPQPRRIPTPVSSRLDVPRLATCLRLRLSPLSIPLDEVGARADRKRKVVDPAPERYLLRRRGLRLLCMRLLCRVGRLHGYGGLGLTQSRSLRFLLYGGWRIFFESFVWGTTGCYA